MKLLNLSTRYINTEKNNEKLPKGHSKWKKNDWLNKAKELELVH